VFRSSGVSRLVAVSEQWPVRMQKNNSSMPLSKHFLPGKATGIPLLKMLRRGKEVRRGTVGDAAAPSVKGGSPQAALSMESLSTSISRRQSGLYHWYNEQLASRPLATKAWTCFVGATFDDSKPMHLGKKR
jgi:hypothetical protein